MIDSLRDMVSMGPDCCEHFVNKFYGLILTQKYKMPIMGFWYKYLEKEK